MLDGTASSLRTGHTLCLPAGALVGSRRSLASSAAALHAPRRGAPHDSLPRAYAGGSDLRVWTCPLCGFVCRRANMNRLSGARYYHLRKHHPNVVPKTIMGIGKKAFVGEPVPPPSHDVPSPAAVWRCGHCGAKHPKCHGSHEICQRRAEHLRECCGLTLAQHQKWLAACSRYWNAPSLGSASRVLTMAPAVLGDGPVLRADGRPPRMSSSGPPAPPCLPAPPVPLRGGGSSRGPPAPPDLC